MTIQELIPKIMEHADEYAVESEEEILVGMVPRRRHKRPRIQKKWRKRFGEKPVYDKKKCRKIDVTLDMVIEFCAKYGYPLPEEIQAMAEVKPND